MNHTSNGICNSLKSDLDVKGDLEVKATGTNSLMQKEVRSQRLTMFLQTAQSPAIAPFVKISKLVSELAYSLDLDPDEILNDPEEAAVMAQIIGMQNAGQTIGDEAEPLVGNPELWEAFKEHLTTSRTWTYRHWWWQHRNRKCTGCRGK